MMTFRHAAAFVLVGWYLMVPPMHDDDWGLSAPLGEWKTAGVYDSANDCERARVEYQTISRGNRILREHSDPLKLEKFIEDVQCIATDDPRLKGH